MPDERSRSRSRAVRRGQAAAVSGAEVAGRATGGTEGAIKGAAGDKFVAPKMKSGENALTPAYRARVRKARTEFNARKAAGNPGPTTKDAAKALRNRGGTY